VLQRCSQTCPTSGALCGGWFHAACVSASIPRERGDVSCRSSAPKFLLFGWVSRIAEGICCGATPSMHNGLLLRGPPGLLPAAHTSALHSTHPFASWHQLCWRILLHFSFSQLTAAPVIGRLACEFRWRYQCGCEFRPYPPTVQDLHRESAKPGFGSSVIGHHAQRTSRIGHQDTCCKAYGELAQSVRKRERVCVLFIFTQYSNLYTAVDTPAEAAWLCVCVYYCRT
jgi:hypothetical protein